MPYTKNEIHLMLEHLNEKELKKVYRYINEIKGRKNKETKEEHTKEK